MLFWNQQKMHRRYRIYISDAYIRICVHKSVLFSRIFYNVTKYTSAMEELIAYANKLESISNIWKEAETEISTSSKNFSIELSTNL